MSEEMLAMELTFKIGAMKRTGLYSEKELTEETKRIIQKYKTESRSKGETK